MKYSNIYVSYPAVGLLCGIFPDGPTIAPYRATAEPFSFYQVLEVPELRLLYHTPYDISESFHGTPQIVLFDFYDKFMSISKCHFCPYCHTECLREAEKPGPLANFDDC